MRDHNKFNLVIQISKRKFCNFELIARAALPGQITYLCLTLCGNMSVQTHRRKPLLSLPSNDSPADQTMQRDKVTDGTSKSYIKSRLA